MASKYQIVYTKQFFVDFNNIADYYIDKFKNKDLIINLERHIRVRENLIMSFPYSFTLFESNILLKHEYRTFNALNYKVFYYIDEIAKIVYFQRILFGGIDFSKLEL